MINFRNFMNKSLASGFVYMSSSCSVVEIGNNCIIRSRACSGDWWYEIFMCFVRGVIFGDSTNSSAPRLSSNALQNIVGAVLAVSIFLNFNSFNRLMIGITSRNACDKLIYSASVVLRLQWVCNLDCHTMGQPASNIKNPVRDVAVLALNSAVTLY